MPITTNVVSSNPAQARCTPCTSVSSANKTDRHDIAEILLKMALNTIFDVLPLPPLSAIFQLYHGNQF